MKYIIFKCGKNWGLATTDKAIALVSYYDNGKVGRGYRESCTYHWFPKSMVKISNETMADGEECRSVQIPYWLFAKKSVYPEEIWAFGYKIVDIEKE